MGTIVIKAAPDLDLYLLWSTFSDSAIWVGDRAGLIEQLNVLDAAWPSTSHAERIARADMNGSSALTPVGRCHWDEDFIMVRLDDAHYSYSISRPNLAPYAQALLAGDGDAAFALLDRIPVDDEPSHPQ